MSAIDKDFALERYKYILSQKAALNRTTFHIVSLYQAALALSVAGQYVIAVSASKEELGDGFVNMASAGLCWFLVATTLFCVLMITSGVSAWLGYRKDEGEIEDSFLGGRRPMPRVSNAWKWYEVYVILGVIIVTGLYCFFFYHLEVFS